MNRILYIFCVSILMIFFLAGCRQQAKPISVNKIQFSCGYITCNDTTYYVCYIFDFIDKSESENVAKFGNYVSHNYTEGEGIDVTRFAFRAYERLPCFAIIVPVINPGMDTSMTKISGPEWIIDLAEAVRVNMNSRSITCPRTNGKPESIAFPEYNNNVFILTPDLKYHDTGLKALNLFGYHKHCLKSNRILFDPGVLRQEQDDVVKSLTVEYGQYLPEVAETAWFKSIEKLSINGFAAGG